MTIYPHQILENSCSCYCNHNRSFHSWTQHIQVHFLEVVESQFGKWDKSLTEVNTVDEAVWGKKWCGSRLKRFITNLLVGCTEHHKVRSNTVSVSVFPVGLLEALQCFAFRKRIKANFLSRYLFLHLNTLAPPCTKIICKLMKTVCILTFPRLHKKNRALSKMCHKEITFEWEDEDHDEWLPLVP